MRPELLDLPRMTPTTPVLAKAFNHFIDTRLAQSLGHLGGRAVALVEQFGMFVQVVAECGQRLDVA